jgi:hypothetical protein
LPFLNKWVTRCLSVGNSIMTGKLVPAVLIFPAGQFHLGSFEAGVMDRK